MSVNCNATSDHWVRSTSFKLEGKAEMVRGCEISVRGVRGRFRFHEHVETAGGRTWISVYGPITGGAGSRAQWRFFAPGKVKTVHRVTKGRGV